MTYLEVINRADRKKPSARLPNILVSGTDERVRQVIAQDILSSVTARGLRLFLIDLTSADADFSAGIGSYPVQEVSTEGICFCPELLDTVSLDGISRLRGVLSALGMEDSTMKIVAFLDFVRQTERYLGNNTELTFDLLEQYGGPIPVGEKLSALVAGGVLTEQNKLYLLGRYAEVSAASAAFEEQFPILRYFFGGPEPAPGRAVRLPFGRYSEDPKLQNTMVRLLLYYLRRQPEAAVWILDDGRSSFDCAVELLSGLPPKTEAFMVSADAFRLPEKEVTLLMNTFAARVYSAHSAMSSCKAVSAAIGTYEAIEHTKAVCEDHRLRTSSVWDKLLDLNKTETKTQLAPIIKPMYKAEYIQGLPKGVAILDYVGSKSLLPF